jgi:ubiquinone/menaquinone biosynthesis C-methylase UbiE
MTDMATYRHSLLAINPLIEPLISKAIKTLQLPLASHGLDAGCGIGLQTLPMANEVGPAGRVTGLDISPQLLAYARELVAQAGLLRRISFQVGDVRNLPFDNNSFDWTWSADCVGYAPLEPLPLVKEMVRVVKPGGLIAILAWSSQMLLPGYPILEAHLNATSAGVAPFCKGKLPETHFLRALGWFLEAGLEKPVVSTLSGQAYAPLTDDLRRALTSLFEMRWAGVESELTPEDRAEYQRLCLPQSPDFILNNPDYYGFFTYSMFCGTVI